MISIPSVCRLFSSFFLSFVTVCKDLLEKRYDPSHSVSLVTRLCISISIYVFRFSLTCFFLSVFFFFADYPSFEATVDSFYRQNTMINLFEVFSTVRTNYSCRMIVSFTCNRLCRRTRVQFCSARVTLNLLVQSNCFQFKRSKNNEKKKKKKRKIIGRWSKILTTLINVTAQEIELNWKALINHTPRQNTPFHLYLYNIYMQNIRWCSSA